MKGKVTKIEVSRASLHTSTFHMGNEDAIHPYLLHFSYSVDGVSYTGKSNWHWYCLPQKKNESLTVFYDSAHPARHALQGL